MSSIKDLLTGVVFSFTSDTFTDLDETSSSSLIWNSVSFTRSVFSSAGKLKILHVSWHVFIKEG